MAHGGDGEPRDYLLAEEDPFIAYIHQKDPTLIDDIKQLSQKMEFPLKPALQKSGGYNKYLFADFQHFLSSTAYIVCMKLGFGAGGWTAAGLINGNAPSIQIALGHAFNNTTITAMSALEYSVETGLGASALLVTSMAVGQAIEGGCSRRCSRTRCRRSEPATGIATLGNSLVVLASLLLSAVPADGQWMLWQLLSYAISITLISGFDLDTEIDETNFNGWYRLVESILSIGAYFIEATSFMVIHNLFNRLLSACLPDWLSKQLWDCPFEFVYPLALAYWGFDGPSSAVMFGINTLIGDHSHYTAAAATIVNSVVTGISPYLYYRKRMYDLSKLEARFDAASATWDQNRRNLGADRTSPPPTTRPESGSDAINAGTNPEPAQRRQSFIFNPTTGTAEDRRDDDARDQHGDVESITSDGTSPV